MNYLNGSELAGFIKERQAKAVRSVRQGLCVIPKLAIVQVKNDPVINTYVRLKKAYGSDILIEVETYMVPQDGVPELIARLNSDVKVHGIIIQLPLTDPSKTDELCNLVDPLKDVDALGEKAVLQAATPMAILWLLAGYNVQLEGKRILIIGNGKLVGKPLSKSLKNSGYDVVVADRATEDLKKVCLEADIIITATGSPAILYPNMIKENAVVVDAGVASEEGKIVGDVAPEVYEREDLTITPAKGGVGPLTICALFENVLIAARGSAKK